MDDIAGHQFLGRQRNPGALTAHPRLHVQLLAQERQGLLRAAFLQQTQDGVQHEQSADHRRLHVLAEEELDNDRRFEKPGDGCPEPFQELLQRVGLFLNNRIGAELLQQSMCFGSGQPTAVVVGDGHGQFRLWRSHSLQDCPPASTWTGCREPLKFAYHPTSQPPSPPRPRLSRQTMLPRGAAPGWCVKADGAPTPPGWSLG